MLIALIVIVAVLAYVWVGYPCVALTFGRMRHRPPAGTIGRHAGPLPEISVLLSAHNEEAVMRQRLENLATVDYPADRLRIFVGVDGGEDRTAEIALSWAQTHPGVCVVVGARNHGKTAMLKRLVEACGKREAGSGRGAEDADSAAVPHLPLLVFTDANTVFARDALKRLVAPFADDKIGGVCGRLVFGPGSVGTDESIYWDLETRLKVAESSLDSCLGANGAIYAIRGELFPDPGINSPNGDSAFPDNTIVDDFVLGMKVREQGRRMVYEPAALATEELPETVGDEWRRRVRIGRGVFQALWLCRQCLRPQYGVFAWMFWSHKVLRWFTPHLVLALVGCSAIAALTAGESTSLALALLPGLSIVGVAGVLAASLIGAWVGFLRPVRYFVLMQAALFTGFVRFCRGDVSGTWQRTERGGGHDVQSH